MCSTYTSSCLCDPGYTDIDCSKRLCPFSQAWVDRAGMASPDANGYAECSNQGVCDRDSGQCECREGFTGKACSRTTCPGGGRIGAACNGHGECLFVEELAQDPLATKGAKEYEDYQHWDRGRLRACKCDAGFTGHDCSLHKCPRGDDPLTYAAPAAAGSAALMGADGADSSSAQAGEIQNVTVQSRAGLLNGGQVAFRFTDQYDGVWTTQAVDLPNVRSWHAGQSRITAPVFQWVETSVQISSSALQTDATTGAKTSMAHTLNAAFSSSTAAYVPRKGDWLLLYQDNDSRSQCMFHVASDMTSSTVLETKIHSSQGLGTAAGGFPAGTCLDATATSSKFYAAWTAPMSAPAASGTATSINGLNLAVTAYDSSTGALTIEAGMGVAAMRSYLFPGTWIRIYDYGNPTTGSYCDMRVKLHPDSDTRVVVDAATASSTKQDAQSDGMSSVACQTFTGKKYALAHIKSHSMPSDGSTAWPVTATADRSFAVDQHGRLRRTNTAGAAQPFASQDAKYLQAGAHVALVAEDYSIVCAGTVTGSPGGPTFHGTLTEELDLGPPSGAMAAAGVASCADSASARAGIRAHMIIFSSNSIHFANRRDETNPAPMYSDLFKGVREGDWLSISGASPGANDDLQTLRVDRVGISSAGESSRTRAVYFSFGSVANGGGMYPILAVMGSAPNYLHHRTTVGTAKQPYIAATPDLGDSTLVQVYHSGSCDDCTTVAADVVAADADMVRAQQSVRRVLRQLPDRVLPDVSVKATSRSLSLYAFTVRFTSPRNSGDVPDLVMLAGGCRVDGCQPFYEGVRTQRSFARKDLSIAPSPFRIFKGSDAAEVATVALSFDAYFSSISSGGGGVSAAPGSSRNNGQGIGLTDGDTVMWYGAQQTSDGSRRDLALAASASEVALLQRWVSPATMALPGTTVSGAVGVYILRARGAHGPTNLDSTAANAYFVTETYEIHRGTTEALECSGRGKCDYDSGACMCIKGYGGEACEVQGTTI